MTDGLNNARALRISELASDSRALQMQIQQLTSRYSNNPDRGDGFMVLRECGAQIQRLTTTTTNPIDIQPGQVPDTDVQKAQLQRVMLDASYRRFKAHKIYLTTAAAVRWIQGRDQIQQQGSSNAAALQALSQRLRQEIAQLTDNYVYVNLRTADTRKAYWVEGDPTLEQVLAYGRAR